MDRKDFIGPVERAIRSHGGSATLVQVTNYIWDHHERDIRGSGDLFYRWQYEVRWAASELRKAGVMKAANLSPKGIWELA